MLLGSAICHLLFKNTVFGTDLAALTKFIYRFLVNLGRVEFPFILIPQLFQHFHVILEFECCSLLGETH